MSPTPPPIHPAHRHQRRSLALFAACGAAWLGFMGAVIAWVPQVRVQQAVGLGSFVVLGLALWALDRHLERHFRCPRCGGPVKPAEDTAGRDSAPLLRECPACHVRWQVGRTPSSS